MMNYARFARPYARAAFDYAQEHQQLQQWSVMLQTLAERIQQPLVLSLLKNPQYSAETHCEMMLALGHDVLNDAGQNFIKTLANHQRLFALPEIFTLFEQLRATVEKTHRVKIKSAIPLSDSHSTQLNLTLSKQLGSPVELECELDPSLLGGFVIYMGDRVIDSSVRRQLEKLREAVTN